MLKRGLRTKHAAESRSGTACYYKKDSKDAESCVWIYVFASDTGPRACEELNGN